MTPFARIRREAKNAARQAAEIAAVANLPTITMIAGAIVRPADSTTPVVSAVDDGFDDIGLDDDAGTYPKIYGAPEPVNFRIPE